MRRATWEQGLDTISDLDVAVTLLGGGPLDAGAALAGNRGRRSRSARDMLRHYDLPADQPARPLTELTSDATDIARLRRNADYRKLALAAQLARPHQLS